MTALAHSCVRSFPNDSALGKYLRVKDSSGNLALAGEEDELGVMEENSLAGDAVAPVRFLEEGKSIYMVASGAISQFADVYRTTAGKITATQGTSEDRLGVALEAATADGDVIEVLPKRLQTISA